MIFQFKLKFLIFLTILCAAAAFSGCASGTNQTNAPTNTQSSAQSNVKAPPRVEIKDGDKIGVAECDDYLAKYEACANKVPEPGRGAMLASISQLRKSWITIAVNPETRVNLANECKQSLEETKQNLRSYACQW